MSPKGLSLSRERQWNSECSPPTSHDFLDSGADATPKTTLFITLAVLVLQCQEAAKRDLKITWVTVNGHQVGAPVRGQAFGNTSQVPYGSVMFYLCSSGMAGKGFLPHCKAQSDLVPGSSFVDMCLGNVFHMSMVLSLQHVSSC